MYTIFTFSKDHDVMWCVQDINRSNIVMSNNCKRILKYIKIPDIQSSPNVTY